MSVLVTTRRWLFAWRRSIKSMAAYFLQALPDAQESAHRQSISARSSEEG